MRGRLDADWGEQAGRVAGICDEQLPGLVGVYVHGSAALGGIGPASDLDVLVVAEGGSDWPVLGRRLLSDCRDDRPLELSVVEAQDAEQPLPPWPYHLHVNSGESRFGLGAGRGDRDLIAHYAVVRAAGIAVLGPAAASVVGPVPRPELIDYLRAELQEGAATGDQRYAVLNACRAVAFAETGRLLSKIDGGRWWLTRPGHHHLVEEALTAQELGEDIGPCSDAARSLVTEALRLVT